MIDDPVADVVPLPRWSGRPLVEYPRFRQADALLHKLWGLATESPGYNKRQWQQLEAALFEIARHGVGEPDEAKKAGGGQ